MDNYNEEQFKIDFPKTEIGKKLLDETPDWITISYSPVCDLIYAPRGALLTFHVSLFFYILKLLEKNPKVLADIGCGTNFFKKFIPEIHGMDPVNHPNVDQIDYFDENFSIGHTNKFDCAMTINSLHFISLKDISKQLKSFSNIIKPGGRGFVTLNTKRMIEHTDQKDTIQGDQLSSYIKQQVDQALPNVLSYDDYINDTRFIAPMVIMSLKKSYKDIKDSKWPTVNSLKDWNDLPDWIKKECDTTHGVSLDIIQERIISKYTGLDDIENGNVRIVFEKEK